MSKQYTSIGFSSDDSDFTSDSENPFIIKKVIHKPKDDV